MDIGGDLSFLPGAYLSEGVEFCSGRYNKAA